MRLNKNTHIWNDANSTNSINSINKEYMLLIINRALNITTTMVTHTNNMTVMLNLVMTLMMMTMMITRTGSPRLFLVRACVVNQAVKPLTLTPHILSPEP